MDLGLHRKRALITGANRGSGATIAIEPVKEGVPDCPVARDPAKHDHIAADIRRTSHLRAAAHAADLRKPAAAATSVETAIDALGRLDVFVNNAGATWRADFFTQTGEDFHVGFALKFRGHVRVPDAIRAMTGFLASAGADDPQGSIIDIDGGTAHSL